MFMSFNLNESKTYINIKLTDAGRRQLSMGRLLFSKAVFSDREIDYGIDRSKNYDILNNRILSPADAHPDIDLKNLDGTFAWKLSEQDITVAKVFTTANTITEQFFTKDPFWNDGYKKDRSAINYASQTFNSQTLTLTAPMDLNAGDLVWIPWFPSQTPGGTYLVSFPPYYDATGPFLGLWYRIISASSATVFIVDRPLPKFNTAAKTTKIVVYPFNGIETYFGSGATQNCPLWNLNIVRTKSIAGTDDSSGVISGYTRYGSLQYAGTKQYFGFGAETPAVGFIHHTNMYSGNTSGEQLIEKSVKIHMPNLMWHHKYSSNGNCFDIGHVFYDVGGDTYYDNVAKTTYRNLCDNQILSAGTIVGRVYHKLKIIVISDQELLAAMSYKSNRNYTYPEPIVSLTTTPNTSMNTAQATGLCKSDFTYFVTYLPESDSYGATTSYGYPDALHSMYIKKIDGKNDINGNPQYLSLSFPANSFPYMRNSTLLAASGTGWNANYVQLLISEQPTSMNYDVSNVPPTSWKRVSVRASGGNGVYNCNTYGDNTIDPVKLNNHRFVISQQDYTSGTTYVLNTGMTINQNVLNFGDEHMFFGIVEASYFNTSYKSLISLYATNLEFVESENSTFDPYQDENVYVTEVAILDDKNQVVAVGKPTYPIKKEANRYFTFQLQIDF